MTEFMYINTAENSKTGENVREQEISKLKAAKAEGKIIIGIELNVPKKNDVSGLNEFCDFIIDPQHTEGRSDVCCAKEVSQNADKLLSEYKGEDVLLICPRIDIDAVAAMVEVDDFLNGRHVECNEYIEMINAHDTHKKGKWEGPILTQSDVALLNKTNKTPDDEKYLREKLAIVFNPNDKMKAFAASIKVFVDYSKEESVEGFKKNIENVRTFIKTGKIDEEILKNYAIVQNGIIDRIMSGEIKVDYKGGGMHIETKLPGMTDLVYAGAPAGTIYNPVIKKWTVCQYEEGYLQTVNSEKTGKPVLKIAEKLGQKEHGWGGSTTICGSPMGQASVIEPHDMKRVFYANLTPEYKAKVTSNAGNANSGKGMGE